MGTVSSKTSPPGKYQPSSDDFKVKALRRRSSPVDPPGDVRYALTDKTQQDSPPDDSIAISVPEVSEDEDSDTDDASCSSVSSDGLDQVDTPSIASDELNDQFFDARSEEERVLFRASPYNQWVNNRSATHSTSNNTSGVRFEGFSTPDYSLRVGPSPPSNCHVSFNDDEITPVESHVPEESFLYEAQTGLEDPTDQVTSRKNTIFRNDGYPSNETRFRHEDDYSAYKSPFVVENARVPEPPLSTDMDSLIQVIPSDDENDKAEQSREEDDVVVILKDEESVASEAGDVSFESSHYEEIEVPVVGQEELIDVVPSDEEESQFEKYIYDDESVVSNIADDQDEVPDSIRSPETSHYESSFDYSVSPNPPHVFANPPPPMMYDMSSAFPNPRKLEAGTHVKIIAGKYQSGGGRAVISSLTPKMAYVHITAGTYEGDFRRLMQTSLVPDPEYDTMPKYSSGALAIARMPRPKSIPRFFPDSAPKSSGSSSMAMKVGSKVKIIDGKYAGGFAIVKKMNSCKPTVTIVTCRCPRHIICSCRNRPHSLYKESLKILSESEVAAVSCF